MGYLELTVTVLVTTVAVLLAWFLIKKKQNSLILTEEQATRGIAESKCAGADDEEPFDIMAAREKLAPFLLNSNDLTFLDGEPAQTDLPNIHTFYKKSRLKIPEMEKTLTKDEVEDERNTQRKQLEEIFKMMEKNKEQYGMDSFEDLEDQMKLYSFK